MGAPHKAFRKAGFQLCAVPILLHYCFVSRAGPIPRELARLITLKTLVLGGNMLTGKGEIHCSDRCV